MLESYIWKKEKQKFGGETYQESIKLVDCTQDQLQEFYNHCKIMLYNDNRNHPGRFMLLKTIADQRNRCGVELFLRYLEKDKLLTRFTFMESIRSFININRDAYEQMKKYNAENNLGPLTVEFVASGCDDKYKNLPLDLVIDGALDRLGKFNKAHLTLTFILKQGVWFTPQEEKELSVKDANGRHKDKIQVVKERLNLRQDSSVFITPKGLSFSQLRAMINLTSKKYSELTTEQLSTLRYRMLFALEDRVQLHITQWTNRINQITEVAEYKGYEIK
jgi:hypothetical protein